MTHQIVIGDDVAAELGPKQTALVRAGDAAPPVFECLVCRQPGDMRVEPSAAVRARAARDRRALHRGQRAGAVDPAAAR